MTSLILSAALLLTPAPITAPKETPQWPISAIPASTSESMSFSIDDLRMVEWPTAVETTSPVSDASLLVAAPLAEPPPLHPKWLTDALNTPGLSDRQLDRLGHCESTNNYRIDTGNGFYGRVQWLRSTWDAVARRLGAWDYVGVKPSLAEPVVQDGFTKWWWTNSSPRQQWPVCSQRIGAA